MDITMCNGKGCPLKEKCLRYKGKLYKLYHMYFIETPYHKVNCEFFIELKKDK